MKGLILAVFAMISPLLLPLPLPSPLLLPSLLLLLLLLRQQVEDDLPDFPIMNTMTRPLRKAAADHRNIEFQSLWAGQAFALTSELPAADLVTRVVDEAERIMERMQG